MISLIYFFAGPYQSGASANQVYVLNQLAVYVAHIISEAGKLSSGTGSGESTKFTVEPTSVSEYEWTVKVLMRAEALGRVLHCTPGYNNREGLQLDDREALVAAKSSIWGEGIKSYIKEIEDWRQMGGLVGLDVQSRNDPHQI